MQFRIKKVLVRWFKLENKNNWYDYFFFWMSVINPLRRDLIIKRGRSMPFHLSNHLSLVSLIKLFFSSLRSGPQKKKKNWHFWDKQIKGDPCKFDNGNGTVMNMVFYRLNMTFFTSLWLLDLNMVLEYRENKGLLASY